MAHISFFYCSSGGLLATISCLMAFSEEFFLRQNSLQGMIFSVFSCLFFYLTFVVGGGLTVALNLLSIKSIPLGYFYPLINMSFFGIFLGTDSFGISHGSRFFPSITVVYGSGFYEFTGFIFVAAATASLTLFNQTGQLSGSLERIKSRSELKLSRSEIFAVIFGVLLLLVAAIIEALGILSIRI